MYVDCDVLVPASVGGVITAENAGQINAKLVVEAANNPTTSVAEEMLFKRGVLVIPDMLVNAGGVIGSYVEYLRGSVEEAFAMIDTRIRQNTRQILEGSINSETIALPREVAMRIAVKRVYQAMRDRGERVHLSNDGR